MKLESLHDLYLLELSGLYSAEKQIFKALPKLIQKTQSPELRQALERHLDETRGQVTRIENIFEIHGEKPQKVNCKGMEGVLADGGELTGQDAVPALRDAAIISTMQRVELYEMAAYGTVRTYAEQLGHGKAATELQQTLHEETAAHERLSGIGARRINIEATRTA